MASPILRQTGSVFIPVRDIVRAKNWYREVLDVSEDLEIQFGHLCVLPMAGSGVILDQMPMWGGREPEGPPNYQTPAFTCLTDDLEASYEWMKNKGAHMVTGIEDNHWFVFKDPDENMLMVCKV